MVWVNKNFVEHETDFKTNLICVQKGFILRIIYAIPLFKSLC